MAYRRSAPDFAARRMDPARRRIAFTLVELAVSVAVLAILSVGMSSAILLATHALPGKKTPQSRSSDAAGALQRIAADLAFATTIPQRGGVYFTFSVHDRNHGSAGAESVKYGWSGVAGAPLTREYNGGAASNAVENVHAFALQYVEEPVPLLGPPRVLLIVKNPASLTTDEAQRKTLMETWGMSVTTISCDATEGQIRTAANANDVTFITAGTYKSALFNVINTLTRGVVSEEPGYVTALGIAAMSQNQAQRGITIVKNNHPVTSAWPIGAINIMTSNDALYFVQAPIASGAVTLGELSVLLVLNGPALVVLDDGATNVQGNPSPGRRVSLPWGSGVATSELTDDGRQMMQRSIAWAAEPHVVTSIQLVLQVGPHAAGRVQTGVRLLNQPRKDGT